MQADAHAMFAQRGAAVLAVALRWFDAIAERGIIRDQCRGLLRKRLEFVDLEAEFQETLLVLVRQRVNVKRIGRSE